MFEFKFFFKIKILCNTFKITIFLYIPVDFVKRKIKQEGNTFDVNIAAHLSQHPLTKLLHSGMLKLGRGLKS